MKKSLQRLLCCLLALSIFFCLASPLANGSGEADWSNQTIGPITFRFEPNGQELLPGKNMELGISFSADESFESLTLQNIISSDARVLTTDWPKKSIPFEGHFGYHTVILTAADIIEETQDVRITVNVNGYSASFPIRVMQTPATAKLTLSCKDKLIGINTDSDSCSSEGPVGVDVGTIFQLESSALDEHGDEITSAKILFDSDNELVASVTQNGTVYCNKVGGPVTITASYNKREVYVVLNVREKFSVSFVSPSTGSLTLQTGAEGNPEDKMVLQVAVSPPDYEDADIEWKWDCHSDPVDLVTITPRANYADITLKEGDVRTGSAVVTVSARPKEGAEAVSARCTITVVPPTLPLCGVIIDSSSFPKGEDGNGKLAVGGKGQLTAKLIYDQNRNGKLDDNDLQIPAHSGTQNPDVTWSSDPNTVADVWSNGTVNARGGGIATITVETTDNVSCSNPTQHFKNTFKVEVTEPIGRFSLSPLTMNLTITKTQTEETREERPLSVKFLPEGSNPNPKPEYYVWTTSNPDIAKFKLANGDEEASINKDTSGTVTIIATGPSSSNEHATIIVKPVMPGGKELDTAQCEVYVSMPLTGLRLKYDGEYYTDEKGKPLSGKEIHLHKGETDNKLEAVPIPDGATNQNIIWRSDNSRVYISSTGQLRARECTDGKAATITATDTSTGLVASCFVFVDPTHVTSVELTSGFIVPDGSKEKTASVSMGSKLLLTAKVNPAEATNQGLVWSTDPDPSPYIMVTQKGEVRPIKMTPQGERVAVKVTSKENPDSSDVVYVTVSALPLTGIRLDPPDPITLNKGDTQTFKAILLPNGADDPVIWQTSRGTKTEGTDDGVISFKKENDKTVTVTATAPGESGIMVSTTDGAFPYSVKITVSGVQLGTKQDDGSYKTSYTVAAGSTLSVPRHTYGSAKLLPATDWEWSSADDSIARVNPSSGQITGVKPGTTEITCKNGSYSCKITVTVTETTGNVLQKEMVLNDTRFAFSEIIDDLKDQCRDILGEDLDYISSLFVDSSQGTLYYGHLDERETGEGVASGDKFYLELSETTIKSNSAPPPNEFLYKTGTPFDKLIKWIYFVPKKNFGGSEENTFSGIAEIDYAGYTASGKSYNATLRIIVKTRTEIPYTSSHGEAVRFRAEDFSEDCKIRTGYPIYSVKFAAPSERYGYLYYDYTGGELSDSNVTDRRYFAIQSEPSVENVYFVPREGYTGSFPISFTGWNTEGKSYTGTIRVTVGLRKSDDAEANIVYKAVPGHRLYFDVSDFATLCKTSTGRALDHIVFTTVPQDEKAALYNGSEPQRIMSGETYYYTTSSNRMLRNVNLLPDVDFTGPLTIAFEGYNISQEQFYGSVTIEVEKNGSRAADVYIESNGLPAVFRRADFTEACKDALKGELTSVRFSLPPSSSGTIYEHFSDLTDRTPLADDTEVDVSKLMELSFLPKGGYDGSCYISYTGKDAGNNTCRGTLRVSVWPDTLQSYFKDMDNAAWAAQSVEFLRQYGIVSGSGKKMFRPSEGLKRGDFVLMLSRAYDFPLNGSSSFSDVPSDSYYAGAIATAKAMGLVKGSGSRGVFRPNDPISRQDAFTILYRLLLDKKLIEKGNTSSISGFYDQSSVASYAVEPISALVRNGLIQGSGNRIYPTSSLTRAEMAVILHRALT